MLLQFLDLLLPLIMAVFPLKRHGAAALSLIPPAELKGPILHLYSNTAASRHPEKRSLVSRPQYHLLNKSAGLTLHPEWHRTGDTLWPHGFGKAPRYKCSGF